MSTSQSAAPVAHPDTWPQPCAAGADGAAISSDPAPTWLAAAERELTAALTAARMSVARCEQALALLAEGRMRVLPAPVPTPERPRSWRPTSERDAEWDDDRPRQLLHVERLTAREAQILELVARGHSNRGVAEAHFLSPRTVERHLANLYRKLRVHNRAEAVRQARAHQLG
jgi:DNA-binding NarL/FixJ family response regulator